jgi:hypothetical protein
VTWDVVLCSLSNVHVHFDRTSVNIYWNTWYCIPEYCTKKPKTNSIILAVKKIEEAGLNMFLVKTKMVLYEAS